MADGANGMEGEISSAEPEHRLNLLRVTAGFYCVWDGTRQVGTISNEERACWLWAGCDADGNFRFGSGERALTLGQATDDLWNAYLAGEFDG